LRSLSLNLLLDAKWNLKVADFGLTKFKDSIKQGQERLISSISWMAPKILAKEDTNVSYKMADVYSFSIMLWEIFMGVSTIRSPTPGPGTCPGRWSCPDGTSPTPSATSRASSRCSKPTRPRLTTRSRSTAAW
jgi:serine/threonine protein kinase